MAQEATEQPGKQQRPSIAKTFSVVALLTVLSKLVGLLRDIIVAREYGTSIIADAYNYAYLFTGNILILFGGLGGPFHSSTVSIVNPQKDNRDSGILVCQILALTVVALAAVTVLAYLIAPLGVHLMASQYSPNIPVLAHSYAGQAAMEAMNQLQLPANRALYERQLSEQLDIMLPMIVISGIVGVSYGILNVYDKIFWPSLSPAIASIAMIAAISLTDPSKRLIYGAPLAVGALAGAVGQMLAQLPDLRNLPLNWRLTFQPQPGLREYARMLWPAVISTSVGTLTVYVDMAFTFMLKQQGAWTAIVNSNRLVQLPLGILLTAMLVPILPRFTEQVAANKPDQLKAELRRALSFLWFLSLPMMSVLLVISQPIVEVLFQRGNFDESSTALVTLALFYLAPSIVFYVARDLITRVFYAYQDSTTPYKVAMLAIIVKAPLDWLLVSATNSVAGISIATTVMTIFNMTMLTAALRSKIGTVGFSRMLRPLSIMLLATCLCGAVTWAVYYGLINLLQISESLVKLILIAFSSAFGFTAFVGICMLFGLPEPIIFARRVPWLRERLGNKTEPAGW